MKTALHKLKDTFLFLADKGIVTWLLLLLIWWVASLLNPPLYFPGPLTTLRGAWEIIEDGTLGSYLLISLQRIFSGWFLGILVAIPVGLLIGQFKLIRTIFEPFINFFRFVPAIGFLTLFLMWFGVGEASKRALIIYATVFPTIINTIAGVASIDPIKYQAAASQGATAFQQFYSVTVPASIPHVFTGVRLGLSGAIVSIVAAEMLAAQEGIGYLIYTSRLYFRADWIFVGLITLGLLGYISDRLLRLFARTALRRYGVSDSRG